MHRFVPAVALTSLILAISPFAQAQSGRGATLMQKGRFSPHDTISRVIDGNRITIVYGRPYINHPVTHKPRKVWGGLVPYDKIWRVGADEATLFITQQPIDLGGTAVPAGAYTLFMLPAADGSAQLIVNRQIGQWGIDPYHTDAELARIPLQKQELSKAVDEFTISIDNGSPGHGVIKFTWEQTEYSVPFAANK